MRFRKTDSNMSQAEWRAILLGWLLFWALMLSYPSHQSEYPVGYLVYHIPFQLYESWIVYQEGYHTLMSGDWETLSTILQASLVRLFLLGAVAGLAFLPAWRLLPRPSRRCCWDFICLFAFYCLIMASLALFEPHIDWTRGDWQVWLLVGFVHAVLLYFSLTGLCFGHFGSILFARERKHPASTEA